MAFYINEEGRQHINLSNYAMDIIEQDMVRFNDDYKLKNRSGFMNTIISNYYDSFPLSLSVALKDNEIIDLVLSDIDFNNKQKNDLIEKMSDKIMGKLINQYSNKFSKDVSFKLKLNKDNISIIEGAEEIKYFEKYAPYSVIGFYIKMILETYARLQKVSREAIYFKKVIKEINMAVDNRTFIKYKEEGKHVKGIPSHVYPGFGGGNLETFVIIPFSNIKHNLKTIKTLSKQQVRATKERIPFGVSDPDKFYRKVIRPKYFKSKYEDHDYIVKFTEGGLQRFIFEKDSFPLKGIPHDGDKYTYTFRTNEAQMFLHFFKYGFQAQIINSDKLRAKFKKLYKASYEAYAREETKV